MSLFDHLKASQQMIMSLLTSETESPLSKMIQNTNFKI